MVDYILTVSGFGRCGSSLVMQMLYCGGLRFDLEKAPWPYCEDERQTLGGDSVWVDEYVGSALKWLEPAEFVPPLRHRYRTIWLDRDRKQQAKSDIKFQLSRGHKRVRDRIKRRGSRTIRGESMRGRRERRPKSLAIWARRGPLMLLDYERIKLDPITAAWQIAEFSGHELDAEAMAKAVRNRETKCLDGMLEDTLKTEGPPAPENRL